MRTRSTLFPEQNGTKDSSSSTAIVWCVRYRYDAEKKRRYKTVELLVDEAAWEPQIAPDTLMAVRVGADERAVQQ